MSEAITKDQENVPPPPPGSPPPPTSSVVKFNDEDDEVNDQEIEQELTSATAIEEGQSYAEQIAQLEKELGWDKEEEDDQNTNDEEYRIAKKNFAKEVDEYMKQATKWRANLGLKSSSSRYADPLIKDNASENDDDEEDVNNDNDNCEQEEAPLAICAPPPTKSVSTKKTTRKAPSSQPKQTSKPVRSASTTAKKISTNKKRTTSKKPISKQEEDKDGTTGTTLSARNNIPALLPPTSNDADQKSKQTVNTSKKKTSNKKKDATSFHKLLQRSLSASSSQKLPPRKTPMSFVELTKAVFQQQHDSSAADRDLLLSSSVDVLAGALESVKKIDFTNRGLVDLDAFDCIPSVTHAYLGDNHLSSLEGVEVWLNCQVLVLHDNQISKITELFVLRELRYVDLRRNKISQMIDVTFLPETLEVMDLEGNDELVENFLSTDEQKEEFWESCLARCPKLSSIDVVGTREYFEEKKKKKILAMLDAAENNSENGPQQEQQLPIEDRIKNDNNNNNGDDDDDQDDPMLKGNGDKNDAQLSEFVEPMPERSTFADVLKKKKNAVGLNDDDDGINDSSSSDDEEEDEDDEIEFKPEGDGLQARITDADFDEDVTNSSSYANNNSKTGAASSSSSHHTSSLRPVSARNTRNLIQSARLDSKSQQLSASSSARPGSARLMRPGSARLMMTSTRNGAKENDNQEETNQDNNNNDDDDDEVRLRLPIADNVQSNIRSVTDDLLRQYDHVRRHATEAELSRANQRLEGPAELKSRNEKTAQQIMTEYATGTNDDVEVREEQVEQLRNESRDLRRELLFAAQHQSRVASVKVDEIWSEGLEEFKSELRGSLFKRNQERDRQDAENSKNNNQQQKHSSSYERALRLLASEGKTTVEGLEKYRKKREQEDDSSVVPAIEDKKEE